VTKYGVDYTAQLEQIILSDDDIINKTTKIHDLLGKDRILYRSNAEGLRDGIISAREDEKKAMDAVNAALTVYMQKYEMLHGKGGSSEGPKVGETKTIGNTVYEWDGNQWKVNQVLGGGGGSYNDDEIKTLIEQKEATHNSNMAGIRKRYLEGKITTEDQYNRCRQKKWLRTC